MTLRCWNSIKRFLNAALPNSRNMVLAYSNESKVPQSVPCSDPGEEGRINELRNVLTAIWTISISAFSGSFHHFRTLVDVVFLIAANEGLFPGRTDFLCPASWPGLKKVHVGWLSGGLSHPL